MSHFACKCISRRERCPSPTDKSSPSINLAVRPNALKAKAAHFRKRDCRLYIWNVHRGVHTVRKEKTTMKIKSGTAQRSLVALLALAVVWTLCLANSANAQRTNRRAFGAIDAGTTITVRTNEAIDSDDSDGRVFSGSVAQDVMDRRGNLAIPRGSDVELVVKRASNKELILDLDSVTVNGQ